MEASRKRKAEDAGNEAYCAPPRPPPPRGNPPPPRPPLPPRPNTASPSHTIGSSAVSAENSAKNQSAKNEAVVRKPAEVISQATKIGFNLTGSTVGSNHPNTALSRQKITISSKPVTKSNPSPKVTAASIFGDDDDDDDEEEEMPAAARMRMRNCGKFTPTSSGPNTFNKTPKGFVDPRGKVWDKVDDVPDK